MQYPADGCLYSLYRAGPLDGLCRLSWYSGAGRRHPERHVCDWHFFLPRHLCASLAIQATPQALLLLVHRLDVLPHCLDPSRDRIRRHDQSQLQHHTGDSRHLFQDRLWFHPGIKVAHTWTDIDRGRIKRGQKKSVQRADARQGDVGLPALKNGAPGVHLGRLHTRALCLVDGHRPGEDQRDLADTDARDRLTRPDVRLHDHLQTILETNDGVEGIRKTNHHPLATVAQILALQDLLIHHTHYLASHTETERILAHEVAP